MKKSSVEVEHMERLQWVVLLSQMDLNALREGDRMNLKEELYEFIYGKGFLNVPGGGIQRTVTYQDDRFRVTRLSEKASFVKKISPQFVREVQAFIKRCLLSIANSQDNYPLSIEFPLEKGLLSVSANDSSQPFSISWTSGFKLAANVAFLIHLAGSGVTKDMIRTCPQCQGLFILKRKPRRDRNFYCSPRCSRNAATIAYRTRKKAELMDKERKRSKRRYLDKQRRKYGPNVKVAKRLHKARGD